METKFLRLRTPVTIGSRFDDWKVCWLGGWTRDRLSYVVVVVHFAQSQRSARTRQDSQRCEQRVFQDAPLW